MLASDISRVDPRPDLHLRLLDDAWVPEDQEEVDWLLRRAARLEADVAEVMAAVRREVRALEYGLDLETKDGREEAARCRARVEAWARAQQLPADRVVVTTRSSYGRVVRRRLEPKVTVVDEAAAIGAVLPELPECVDVVQRLLWGRLKPLVKVTADGVFWPTTGERIPGLSVEAREDDVKVEPLGSAPQASE